jgi:peptide chain release factor subunit 3
LSSYLTGQVDERTIQKYEREAKANNRESWYLAFIMDTNEEERAKGKTVEVGRAPFETKNKRYTILDAPGHAKFVPNMISGAAQADVGVLVISARKGEFEAGFKRDGQTREHVQLAKTVGISRLIVAINKMDEKTVQWSKERFDQCVDELNPFLKKWGFNEGKNLWCIPISGLTGAGLKDRVTTEMCPWYNNGPSLLDVLDTIPIVERDASGPVRIPVVDKYKDMGSLFIVGKVENGTLVPGKYVIAPSETPVTISSIFIDDDEVDSARPGENVQIMIKDCDEDLVHRGQVLCSASSICHASNKFEAIIAVTDLLEHSPLMTAGYQCVLHLHCLVLECQIVKLVELIVKGAKKGPTKPPAFVKVGANVRCVITVDHPIALETFEAHPQLGRFTLRDEGKTVAIGKITRIGKMKPNA